MITYSLLIINSEKKKSYLKKNFLYPSQVEEEINKLLGLDESYKVVFESLFKIKDMLCPNSHIEYLDEDILVRITRE